MSCHSGSGQTQFTNCGKSGVASFSGASTAPWWDAAALQQKLSAAGLAGLAAYGISNTLYYTGAFLVVWYGVVHVPRGQGIAAAAAAAVKTLAVVWAGSQVTKAPRAGGALLAAPAVDKLLGWTAARLKLASKRNVSGSWPGRNEGASPAHLTCPDWRQDLKRALSLSLSFPAGLSVRGGASLLALPCPDARRNRALLDVTQRRSNRSHI